MCIILHVHTYITFTNAVDAVASDYSVFWTVKDPPVPPPFEDVVLSLNIHTSIPEVPGYLSIADGLGKATIRTSKSLTYTVHVLKTRKVFSCTVHVLYVRIIIYLYVNRK